MTDLILIGAGGHCKSVLGAIDRDRYNIVGVLDQLLPVGTEILDVQVIGDDSIAKELYDKGIRNAFISIGSTGQSSNRVKLVNYYKSLGYTFPAVIDKSAIVGDEVIVSGGAFVGKAAVIISGTVVGEHAIINTSSIVEHDCSISDFSHIAPGSVVCGQVNVGEYTHIGAGSVVIQGINIGCSVIVGAGSIVVKDLPDEIIAFGNPCKIVRER